MTPGSRETFAPIMAERPGQIQNAARNEFDNIAPPNANPSGIGQSVGTAANAELSGARQRINATARPF